MPLALDQAQALLIAERSRDATTITDAISASRLMASDCACQTARRAEGLEPQHCNDRLGGYVKMSAAVRLSAIEDWGCPH
jgi:hypothetical protein